MGNVQGCLRGGRYRVVHGSADTQETTFNMDGDVSNATSGAHTATLMYSQDLSADQQDDIPASQREAIYKQVQNTVSKLERTDSVDNMITCCICLDTMFEPVRAPCNHTFCRVCLRRLLEYEGATPSCPKCRSSLARLDPDQLEIDLKLLHTIQFNFSEELEGRQAEAEEEERAYQRAREDRLRRERLMDSDPLSLMFESEDDTNRRRVLQRDLQLLSSLGFSVVLCQKALFVASGVHAEALHWLIRHQHLPHANIPWNMTQLQEQMAVRNTRRNAIEQIMMPTLENVVSGRLQLTISSMTLASTMGDAVWCMTSSGFRAFHQPELVLLLKCHPSVEPDEQDPFLGDPMNRGFLLCADFGQQLQGVPLPKVQHLFMILLRGPDLEFATRYPAHYLLRCGRRCRTEYPYPLVTDRTEVPVCNVRSLARMAYLDAAVW
ncbi:uncharacterized protein MONBRDRAFT_24134 [Monosiga brevicollis MX1]|uniref:RING-type E3 ubiquitin transferase n=1 Tax=Monosiga brevicollis TaxID=81824 RepID=A9UVH2_MONBE|nr:uncharacterized protein MONBRDRAFT_24134 [Monosiga brevicollis MX1]EDQ90399.1 predicted protein [Monosiga brevicollis MX1]|eukprot:XP_001744450.1 hypothetical protein [Monosiga brevicollis MX1]